MIQRGRESEAQCKFIFLSYAKLIGFKMFVAYKKLRHHFRFLFNTEVTDFMNHELFKRILYSGKLFFNPEVHSLNVWLKL